MPAKKRLTLVVDVNVLIGMLISQDELGIKRIFNKQNFRVVVSPLLLEELEAVLMRRQFRRYFTVQEAERAFQRIKRRTLTISTVFQVKPICRDHKDDYLLALAAAAKAEFLITGDDDLLVLKKHGKTVIIKPAAFRRHFLIGK